jgi:glyoxylase-like metal-dependent hydrolase (beta-lactamase superfamily II)
MQTNGFKSAAVCQFVSKVTSGPRCAKPPRQHLQTLGKPVDRIILSHAHTDHWGGLQILTERFPDARVVALDGIADQVRIRRQWPDEAAFLQPFGAE